MGKIINNLRDQNPSRKSYPYATIGTVVDTADPQEMGRLRVLCPALNDTEQRTLKEDDLNKIPWASYMSPFGGASSTLSRGPTSDQTAGDLAYGFWAIPTVGAQAIVMCIDGDPQLRVWIGCLHEHLTPHTMPHGRFFGTPTSIDGPGSSAESPIKRLRVNLKLAFGSVYEFFSRAADYSVAAVNNDVIEDSTSSIVDSKNKLITLPNGLTIEYSQGYARGKRDTSSLSTNECQTTAWVSPGFHAISMDDRSENCRVRIRTTTGHQILLDDSNERILINTNAGRSYIEMDANGNIDIHADRQLSFHSTKDMSFTSDGKIRFRAQEGIHMLSGKDIRFAAATDIHSQSANIHSHTSESIFLHAGANLHAKAATNIHITAATSNVSGSSAVNIQGGSSTNISSGGMILQTASAIHLNGPPAAAATPATAASSNFAYSTIRVPFRMNGNNEAWSRGMMNPAKTDSDSTLNLVDYYDYANLELPYNSKDVGKVELGEALYRNLTWRR